MRFPEKLERELARCGKTQSAIARETGLNQSAISAMTRGDRRPYMDQALLLARAIGVPLDYLADDDQEERPESRGLPADELAVLKLYRALRLTEDEALRRLAGQLEIEALDPEEEVKPPAKERRKRGAG